MNNITTFSNAEFGDIRVVMRESEPWFVGKDVAEKLGYSNTRKAIADHVETDDKTDGVTIRDSIGRNQKPTIINESGLYSLILGSKLPSAKRFKHWVTSEVLPSIRKNGGYIANQENLSDDELLERALIVAQRKIEERNKEIAQQKELARLDSIQNAKNKKDAELKFKAEKEHSVEDNDSTGVFFAASKGVNKDIILENEKLALTFSTHGGVVKKAVVKNFKGHRKDMPDTDNVTLFDSDDQHLNFMVATKESNISTKDLYFTPSEVTDSTLTLTAEASQGKSLVLTYKLGKDYMLHMSLNILKLS